MRALYLIAAVLVPQAVTAQEAGLVDLARQTLADLQVQSFLKRREYCGFLGYTATGTLVATPAQAGTRDQCTAEFPGDVAAIASYHTHGAFDLGYFNEVPSETDVQSDAAFFMDGFVSTPGGRLWFVDGRSKAIHQICGMGCLPIAPGFVKGANGDIAQRYSFEELLEKLEK